jgi:hypothetical protein
VQSIAIGRRELVLWPGHWDLSAEETIGVQGYTSTNAIWAMTLRQGFASRLTAISWRDDELLAVVAMTGSSSSDLYDVVNWQDDSCKIDERRNVYHDDYVGGFDVPECLMVRSIDAYDSFALQRYGAALTLADRVSLVRPDGYYEVTYTKYMAGSFLRIDILVPAKSFKSESAAISWSKKFAQAARPFAEGTLTSFKLPELSKVDTR